MKVYFDGQECFDISGGASSILDEVQRRAAQAGRVITEIRLDDVIMDSEAFLRVSGGLAVRFTSQPVRGLVLESLDEAFQYIPRLTKGLGEIALHFENNEFDEGEKKLADGAEGLDWLLQVFQKCSSLLTAGDKNGDASELTGSLAESINALGELYSDKKYFQMAFYIRQKLIPEVEKFSLRVQTLRGLASSTQ